MNDIADDGQLNSDGARIVVAGGDRIEGQSAVGPGEAGDDCAVVREG